MPRLPATWRDPALALVLAAALAACWPFARYVGWLGDEGVLLHGATRMLAGELLYRDFFAFLPPAPYLCLEGWLWLFGPTLMAARMLVLAIVAATAGATYRACARAGSRATGIVLALAWVVASQGAWTVVTHHTMTTLLSLAAGVVVARLVAEERPAPRLALWAGALASTAAMVTQTRGALAVAACAGALLVARRGRRELAWLALGVAVVPLAIVSWLCAHGTLGDAIAAVLIWPSTNYAPIQRVAFGAFATSQTAPAAALFPVLAVLVLVARVLGGAAAFKDPRARAWLWFAGAGFVGCFPRADVVHIAFCAPLALPLFAYSATVVVDALGDRAAGARAARFAAWPRRALPVLLAAACFPSLLAFSTLLGEARATPRSRSPRGEVALGPATDPVHTAALLARLSTVPASEPIFFYPYDPLLIFLAGRRQVGRYDIFVPNYSRPDEYRSACEAAATGAEWFVFDTRWGDPALLKVVFPSLTQPNPPEKLALEATLTRAFEPAATFDPWELRRRRAGATAAGCRPE